LLHLLGERGLHELVEVIIVVVWAAKHCSKTSCGACCPLTTTGGFIEVSANRKNAGRAHILSTDGQPSFFRMIPKITLTR
jgi:hypothetical protein